jgi:NAD(P)-dependent dehydrogenase (short-subunit alcohol dehydrogenase family)
MMKPLSQRVALVTGASSGIGEAIAVAPARAGDIAPN